jgi:hypothetical protein
VLVGWAWPHVGSGGGAGLTGPVDWLAGPSDGLIGPSPRVMKTMYIYESASSPLIDFGD